MCWRASAMHAPFLDRTNRAAFVGNDNHVFELTQSLELHDAYYAKVLDRSRKLEFYNGADGQRGAAGGQALEAQGEDQTG